MLKFSDLNIDIYSKNSIVTILKKFFPDSCMPLLIYGLSCRGHIKLVNLESTPNTLLSISADDFVEFMGEDINILNEIDDKYDDIDDKLLWVTFQILNYVIKNQFITLIVESDLNPDILKIVDIFLAHENINNEKAARCFLYIWIIAVSSSYDVCKPTTEFNLENVFSRVDINEDVENLKFERHAFETFLHYYESYLGNKSWKQPKELTRIILSQYDKRSMYNPFAGLASYCTENFRCWKDEDFRNNSDSLYCDPHFGESNYSEEIDPLTWAIGKLRMFVYRINGEHYILGDSSNWHKGKFYNVISTPPFDLKIINENGEPEYADNFVIRRGIDSLKETGMLACVVPITFFDREDTYNIRKFLIDNRFLSDVVYLPDKLFPSTNIRTAIIFASKVAHETVKFIDATNCLYERESDSIERVNILDVEIIANLIEYDHIEESEFDYERLRFGRGSYISTATFKSLVKSFSFDQVHDMNYDMSPVNYFERLIYAPEGFKLVNLSELTTHAIKKTNMLGNGKLIKSNSLQKSQISPYINISSLKECILSDKTSYSIINQKSLLLSSIDELSPSLVCPNEEVLYAVPQILAFYINENVVNSEYLVGELTKDYVKEQIRLNRHLSYSVLSNLKILVPDDVDFLKIEKDIVEKNIVEKYKSQYKEEYHNEYIKKLRQRKHRIQQIMNEFCPAFSLLNICRIKNGGVLQNSDIVAARTGETVDEYFNKLNIIISKIETLITNLVDKDQWGRTTHLDVINYVNNIPLSHVSDNFVFQIRVSDDFLIDNRDNTNLSSIAMIDINEDDISIIFENIIDNAKKWGFTEDRKYIIRIAVEKGEINTSEAVIIRISNNGTPIHPSVDRKRFFDWGYGSGTGIGTWQLKDIVEHYGGTIKLNEFPNDIAGLCTEFEIKLPIIYNE